MQLNLEQLEIAKEHNNLFRQKFHRVILDEVHNIKISQRLQSKSAIALDADFKWCQTGTPVQNKHEDLFSLLQFLEVEHFLNTFGGILTLTRKKMKMINREYYLRFCSLQQRGGLRTLKEWMVLIKWRRESVGLNLMRKKKQFIKKYQLVLKDRTQDEDTSTNIVEQLPKEKTSQITKDQSKVLKRYYQNNRETSQKIEKSLNECEQITPQFQPAQQQNINQFEDVPKMSKLIKESQVIPLNQPQIKQMQKIKNNKMDKETDCLQKKQLASNQQIVFIIDIL